jgi:sRNA-binding carbon storage regulator CsrA
MIVNLSPGEVIHIGDAVTLTVLAVEGGQIRFGLETPEGESPGADEISKDCDEADLKQRRNGWEWN